MNMNPSILKQKYVVKQRTFMITLTFIVLVHGFGMKLAVQSYSHVPVYKDIRQNIKGEFVLKNLIILDPDDHELIAESLDKYGRPLQSVASSTPLYDIMDVMNAGRYRVATVYDSEAGVSL